MFDGFSPEAIDFLWGIRFNNNREWFTAHRDEYTRFLNTPLKEFGKLLYEPFSLEPGHILKVSRILRDTRMHYDIPYRDSLWFSVRLHTETWYNVPNLYFAISPEGVEYGLSLWRPEPAQMEQFRKRIAAEPSLFLDTLHDVERASGTAFTAECYKRPKPCPVPELEPCFSWRQKISCVHTEPVCDGIFGPALANRVSAFWQATRPMYDYLGGLTTRPQ